MFGCFSTLGGSARVGRVLRLEGPLCKLPPVPTGCERVSTAHRSQRRPLFSGPRTESALFVPSGGGCITGGAAPRAHRVGGSGCLPVWELSWHNARRPPCACLPSSRRGSCVCALWLIRELISHQDCPCVKVPSGPRLAEILFSAVRRAHALVSIIHSCVYWWLLCARTCFQR